MSPDQKKFLNHVKEQNIKEIKKMIKSGFSPNFSTGDSFFATPLHYAANSRNLKLVHTLVKEGNAKVDESVINMCLFPMDVRDIEISIYLINVMEKEKQPT